MPSNLLHRTLEPHTPNPGQDRHVKAKAAGALQSLAVDEDNQKKIKSLGAIPLITKLLSSRTPEVEEKKERMCKIKLLMYVYVRVYCKCVCDMLMRRTGAVSSAI